MTFWPPIAFIILMSMELGIHLANHGQPRGNYSLWRCLYSIFVWTALLYFGRFFVPLGLQP